MKVLLTGGTGYLGQALLAGLLGAGHQVAVLSRREPPRERDPRAEWIQGDLAEDAPSEDLLVRHRVVLHSAAMVKSWARDRRAFDRVNVEAYDRLLERCHRLGTSKVIVTGSFLSLGPSPTALPISEADRSSRARFLTDYERTKYLADEVTDRWIARGVPVSTLYPTVLYGPGSTSDGNLVGKMIYWIANGRFPGLIGSGDQCWNYAFLPDVVAGHVLAMDRALPGERYILGGENWPLGAVLRRIHEMVGRPARLRRIPIPAAEALGSVLEAAAWVTGKAPDLTRGVAGVYRHHWAYNSDKAERTLGYRRTSFEQGLAATVDWARQLSRWEARA